MKTTRREFIKETVTVGVGLTWLTKLGASLISKDENTVTFLTKEKHFIFTVKKEFEKVAPNFKELGLEQLVDINFSKYLHNENGPAVVYTEAIDEAVRKALLKMSHTIKNEKGLPCSYWLNGQLQREKV